MDLPSEVIYIINTTGTKGTTTSASCARLLTETGTPPPPARLPPRLPLGGGHLGPAGAPGSETHPRPEEDPGQQSGAVWRHAARLWLAWPAPPAPLPPDHVRTAPPPQHAGAQAGRGGTLQNSTLDIYPGGGGKLGAFHGPGGIVPRHQDAWPVPGQLLTYRCLSTAPILTPAPPVHPTSSGQKAAGAPGVGPGGAGWSPGELTPRLATGHPLPLGPSSGRPLRRPQAGQTSLAR